MRDNDRTKPLINDGEYAAAADKYLVEFTAEIESSQQFEIWEQMNSISVLTISIACYSASEDSSIAKFLSGMARGAMNMMEEGCDNEAISNILREWSADLIFFEGSAACIHIYQNILTAYDDLDFNADLGYSNEPAITDEHYAYLVYLESLGRETGDPRSVGTLSDRIAWKYEVASEEFSAN